MKKSQKSKKERITKMGRPPKNAGPKYISPERKFALLAQAVRLLKANCLDTQSCRNCLLLGPKIPHDLGERVAAFSCPLTWPENPDGWELGDMKTEIFVGATVDNFEDDETICKPCPNEPGQYQKVGDQWIRV